MGTLRGGRDRDGGEKTGIGDRVHSQKPRNIRRESVLGSCSCSELGMRMVSPLSVLLHSSVSPEAKGSSESKVKSEEEDLRRGSSGRTERQ